MSPPNQDESKLEIPALGRNVSLGYLYNERTDQFCTFSIFKRKMPPSVVDLMPKPSSTIEYGLTNTYQEKFRLFKIDASIAANILSGMLSVEGSAHYLKDENQSALDVTGILKYEEHTFVEYLNTHTDECLGLYNTDLLNYKGATHIVSGIEWGGVVAVQFKDHFDKMADKQEISGKLKIEFEKLKGTMSVSGAAGEDIHSTEKSEKSSFKLSVRGDVSLPSQVPSTYQQVQELIQSVPRLIKSTNEGKGVPLRFFLLPIPALKEHLKLQVQENDFAKKIQEGLLTAFVNVFDEISETEQNLNDAYNTLYNNTACVATSERSKIAHLRDNFKISKINFSTKMREALVNVRSGELECILSKICNEYRDEEFSYVKVRLAVYDLRDALNKVEMYQTIRRKYPEVKYFGLTNDLESALLDSSKDCVYVLYMNSKYNEANLDVWAKTRKIFFETLNRPFNRLFLVDCDFPFPTSANFPKDRSVIQQVVKGITTVNDVLAEMERSKMSNPMSLKAVGRPAQLGELYDARTDAFLEYSLLKNNYSASIVQFREQDGAETTYVPSESFRDKCEVLGINSEQQFNILSNMSPMTRSGRYLGRNEKFDFLLQKKCRVKSFVHTRHLTEESVKITDQELWNNIAFEAVNKGATHFVTKIEYGFVSVFTVEDQTVFENDNNDDSSLPEEQLQEYAACLKAVVDRYDSVTDGNGQAQFAKLNGHFVTTVHSDIQEETSKPYVCVNQEELEHFVNTKFIPTLTGTKTERVPIAYVLYPLSNLAQQAGMLCPYVPYGTLATIKGVNPLALENVFDSINVGKTQMSQMTAHFQAYRIVLTDADYEMLEQVKEEFQSILGRYMAQFQKIVRDIKSGDASSVELYSTLLKQFQSSNFFDGENRFIGLVKLRLIEKKIQFFQYLKNQNISFLGRDGGELELNKILTERLDTRIYFLHYRPEWTVEFNEDWVKTLNFFLGSLRKASTDRTERTLYVINAEFGHSISRNVTGPGIHEYRKGALSCNNVVSTFIEEEVTTQTRIEKLENEVRTTMMEELKTQFTNLERQTQPTGTSVQFIPITGSDTMMRNGVASPISTRNQCITCMKEYENKSLEELRLEDYQLGRKGPSQANVFGGNQPQPSTGLFSMGQNTAAAPSFGQTTSAFGGAATTGTGGLFTGLNQQKPQTSFFNSSGTTTSAFGGTTPFSFTNTTSQPGSLFGTSTAPATGGFGNTFGVTQTSQQQPNMSIFGATKPAVSTPFGSFNTPTSTAINKPSPLFGGTSTSFGTATSTAPFSQTTPLFSAANQQQNKQFSFGTSFGAQTTQPTFGTTGSFSFNPPANPSLNFNTGSTFGQAGTAGGGFSSFGTNTTTNFGSSLTNTGFGANTFSGLGSAPGTTGLSLFNPPNTMGAAPNPSISGAPVPFGTTPYKDSPLFYNLILNRSIEDMTKPTNPGAQRQIREASRRKTSTSLNATNGSTIKNLTFPAPKSHSLLKDPFFDGFEEEDQGTTIDILSPKTSVKKLTLKNLRGFSRFSMNNSSFNISATEDTATSDDTAGNGSKLNDSHVTNSSNNNSASELFIFRGPQADTGGLNDSSSSESPSDSFYAAVNNQNVNGNCTFNESYDKGNESAPDENNGQDGAQNHPCGVKSTRVGYHLAPSIKELDLLTDAQGNCFVRNFIVGRHNYGEIRFLDVVNVANLDIDETVLFRHKEVVVYPDDSVKPPVGEGINVPAEIRLDRVWPIDKTTKDPIKIPSKVKALKYEDKLKRSCSRLGAEFVSYDEQTGLWVFRVSHFSKYSCAPEEEEDEDEVIGVDVPKGGGLGGKTIEQLKSFIGPTQALIIEEDAEERQRDAQKSVLQEIMPGVPEVDVRAIEKGYPGGGGDQLANEQIMCGSGIVTEKNGVLDSSLFPGTPAGGDMENMDAFDVEEDKMDNFPDYFGLTEVAKPSLPEQAPTATLLTKLPSVRVPQHRKRDEISFIDATKKQTKFFKLHRFPQSIYKQATRVSFGPSGTFVRVINKSKDYPRANRFIGQAKVEKLTPHREYWNRENNFFELYSSLTTKQLVLVMDNSRPDNLYKLRPDGIIGELIKVFSEDEELKKKQQNSKGKYNFFNICKEEHQLWVLCSLLWPSQELSEAEQEDKGFLIEYRVRLAEWFKSNAKMLFGDQYDASDDTLKGLLKKGMHLEACELAVDQGNFNLALNLSQCCGESQKAMELQMEEWENQGMLEFIPKDILEMYRLCSGLPIWDDIDIKKMSTSEWLQHFAIYLWYICPMHFSIEEAVMHYQASIIKHAQGDYDVEYPSRLDSSIANTCIHLLKAYVTVGYNVKNILNPKTNNPDCLDYKLSWFLMQNLKQFGYVPDPVLIEDLTVGFAGQLESMGMFHWAIYILKTLAESVPRNVMIDRILERNITLKSDQEKSIEFIETLLEIPRSHILAHCYRS